MNKTVRLKIRKNKAYATCQKLVVVVLLAFLVSPNFTFQVKAQTAPTYTTIFAAKDDTVNGLFLDQLSYPSGNKLKFKIIVYANYNTPAAPSTRLKVDLPDGSFINAPVTLTVFSDNGGFASQTVTLNTITSGGAILSYVTSSTKTTWNVDGEGWKEYENTVWADGITSDSGVVLGDMPPCRISNCRAEVTFLVDSRQGNSSAGPVPTPIIRNTASTQTGSTGTTGQATRSATSSAGSTLPKTGPATVFMVGFALAGAAFVGFKMRLIGELSIKRFALPLALKVHQGKDLTEADLITNRQLIKSSLKK